MIINEIKEIKMLIWLTLLGLAAFSYKEYSSDFYIGFAVLGILELMAIDVAIIRMIAS